MPIYDYRCKQCGKTVELFVHGHAGQGALCPVCGGNDLERLMSASSVRVKNGNANPGHTCCGREERCDKPPCSTDSGCHRK